MIGRGVRVPFAALTLASAALLASNTGALAYTSGSVGYDISYLQCGSYPSPAFAMAVSRVTTGQTVRTPRLLAAARAGSKAVISSTVSSSTGGTPTPWWTQPQINPPPSGTLRVWYRPLTWGIIGVDSGYPFMSGTHPGNPCLASEYRSTSRPGLYVNTGYDPIYKDANHTTASCLTQSAAIAGSTEQQKAWAVGCSEAQGDYTYANSKGITSAEAWWLDVETLNSWCGQSGTNCTDLSLNQYTIQGLIDTFTHIGAVPVGIYSNNAMWSAITGNLPVTGATMDWYASGTATAQAAKAYCNSAYSFSGPATPVAIVQFVPNPSTDKDYAC